MSNVRFPLSILKTQEYKDKQVIQEMDELKERGEEINERLYTSLLHDIWQTEFAIEVLETYTDDEG